MLKINISREDIIKALHAAFESLDFIEAFWISGSASFGRMDEYSDIDLRVLTSSRQCDAVFERAEYALNGLDEVTGVHNPLGSVYPNRFYKLKNASHLHLVDLVCVVPETLPVFMDINRMGDPIVLFDRLGIVKPCDTPQQLYKDFADKVEDIKIAFAVSSQAVVERAINRGRFSEAMFFYNHRIIEPLVQVLRYKHCPSRQDFGLRYLQWDLPHEISMTIDELHNVSSFDDLKRNLMIAEKLFLETIA